MKPPSRIHLCALLGRKVFDRAGRCVGRIEEVRASKNAKGECLVQEYLLGRAGLMERLSMTGVAGVLIYLLGARHVHASHRVSWDQLDLTDPKRPRVNCLRDELQPME